MAKKFKELREALRKKVDKKVQKALDDIVNSEDGNELAVAWNDGDEREAEKIVSRSIRDKKLARAVLALMFESVVSEAKESDLDKFIKASGIKDVEYLKKKVANNDWVAFTSLLSKEKFNTEKLSAALSKEKVDRDDRISAALKKLSTAGAVKRFKSFLRVTNENI